jgi:hypothetical protein
MRIGKKQAATKCGEEPGEEWFKQLGMCGFVKG